MVWNVEMNQVINKFWSDMNDVSPYSSIIIRAAGFSENDSTLEVLSQRSDLLELSEHAHNACLTPREPGGITLEERAALASRMCVLNGESVLSEHYASMLPSGHALLGIIEGGNYIGDNDRLHVLIRHVDLVTNQPKDTVSEDIEKLKRVGVGEPDIVRLSELIAFVNYQIRVVQGIRLIGGLS